MLSSQRGLARAWPTSVDSTVERADNYSHQYRGWSSPWDEVANGVRALIEATPSIIIAYHIKYPFDENLKTHDAAWQFITLSRTDSY